MKVYKPVSDREIARRLSVTSLHSAYYYLPTIQEIFALGLVICERVDRPQGEWVKKPHKVYLPRDYHADITDYHDRQYNEEDHSNIEYWWHCNQCDYEADRLLKPIFNFCPNCGAMMKGADDERP